MEVLDSEQVAALLRCSVKTVEERARRGDLPGIKFGDGWVFPAGALVQRLDEMALSESSGRRSKAFEPAPLAPRHPPARRKAPPDLAPLLKQLARDGLAKGRR